MTAQPAAPEAPPPTASAKPTTGNTAASGTSVRRLKRAHTHRWTKADNAAWWTARRAALKARGSPTHPRDLCRPVEGVKLFERFVYCGN
jgi:hypothetical protein